LIKILENIKYKIKYNRLLIEYQALANKKINELEEDKKMLLQNISYKDQIEEFKEELSEYRRKFGRLKGGGKGAKNKSRRKKRFY
jgi:hypothetical protein